MNSKRKEAKGIHYLNFALYAFAGLGIEALYAYFLEPAIYGCTMEEWNVMQSISHWILTCITWGIIAYLLVKLAYKKYNYNIFEKRGKIKIWQWILTAVCVALVLVSNYLDWNGFKVYKEFQSNGVVKFIFQYIYYLFETGLFMLIIVFGQKAFDQWLKKEKIPFGAVVVALTWGLAHWLTKGSLWDGVFTAACGFFFGVVYLLLNRNIKWTYLVLCIMFIF